MVFFSGRNALPRTRQTARGALLLMALVGPWTAAGAAVLDRIAAVVNSEVITLSEVQEEGLVEIQKAVKEYVPPEQDRQLAAVYQKFLDQLIVRRLILQEARKDQLVPSAGEVTATIEDLKRKNEFRSDEDLKRALATEGLTLEMFRRRVGEQLATGRIAGKAVRNKIIVEEKEIQASYEANQEKYRRTPEVTLRHILVPVPAGAGPDQVAASRGRAEEALAKLRGGTDFADVARVYSEGPTAQTGGLLGTMQHGEMAPELEGPAFTLPVGGLSDLILTQAGFNIVKVESRRDEPVAPLEEVREKIREALVDQKYQAKYEEWIAELRRKASVQIRLKGDPDAVAQPARSAAPASAAPQGGAAGAARP